LRSYDVPSPRWSQRRLVKLFLERRIEVRASFPDV
jgi:hypothetical protein